MKFPLLKCNTLVRSDSNVWTVDSKSSFDYSDGGTAEEYLNDVIMNAKDLTSQSIELESKIIDWPSEYHLSSKRANLVRGLKLDGIKNVLELGSGCGAITRCIGEMNIYVDAVEGSLRRAEITKLRCRDLENVNVINANFNELIFPEAAYDAVLLIGVVEYAKKYFPGAIDDKNAVTNLLSSARSALKKEGLLFIAIENRMGLKYWMGASEDHYGQPHVGLYGYPQDEGIRTYDKKEWEHILEMADMKYFQFLYPFPDYKLATVILSDMYVKNDEYAHSTLYRVSSRDYAKPWYVNINEFLILESIHKSGYLEHFANSFFIIISDSADRLKQVMSYDFVYFSDTVRKPIYRTLTFKPQNKKYIIKKRIKSTKANRNAGLVTHNLSRGTYIKGPLLASIWIHSLFECNSVFSFEMLIKTYYAFINEYCNKHEETSDAYDLTPSNIIVDATGSYKVIDSEWSINAKISPEYVLFRGLMWFFYYNRMLINQIYDKNEFSTMNEFIEYGFNLCSLELKQELDKFIELEDQVQREICFQRSLNPVKSMLMNPFHHGEWIFQNYIFSVQIFWAGDDKEFSKKRSMSVSGFFGGERQVLIFKLPHSVISFRYLRLDPAGCPGFFQLFKVGLKRIDLEGTKEELFWQLQGPQEIARYSQMEGVHFCKAALGEIFLSTSDDPQLVFEFPEIIMGDSKKEILQFEVEMDWPKSADYMIAEEALKKEIAIHAQQIKGKEGVIQGKESVIQEKEGVIQEKEGVIQEKEGVIQEKEGNIQKHIAHIDHLHGVIKEYAKGIQNHSEEIKKLAREIEIRDKHIHEFHSQIDSLKMQVENERLSRQVLLNSRSWKLAAPIRWMFVYVRKLKLKLRTIICSISRQYRLIEKSGLFDTAYYLEQHQDVKGLKINPLAHYIWSGSKEGRDPNPLFDTSYYLDENPDIAESGMNPLAHYIRVGFNEGRDPNPLFDTSYYLGENPDIAESGMNPLAHYMKTGFKDARNPSPLFDISYYLYRNPDVAKSGMNPLLHYIIFGARDRRDPNPLFDASYYLDENPDVAETDMNPLAHYIKFGYSDCRNPNPLFDTSYYLDENPDVAKSGINPLIHYIVSGAKEGRSPVPFETPKISIICPVYNVDKNLLHKCICSVLYQSYYYNWELCLVDDGSSKTEIKSMLEKYERKDHRIKVKFLKENQGISVASNEAVSLSTGQYLGFLDDDDELAEDALYETFKVIRQDEPEIIYSDEFINSTDRGIIEGHFKPDYSPDLLLSHNYITHFLVVKKSLFYDVGGFSSKYDGAQDYDLLLKLTERTRKICHVAKPLYLWRQVSTSTSRKSNSKCDPHYAGKTALETALERRKIAGDVLNGYTEFYYRLKRKLINQPLISIIIPFKDESEYLKTCIEGILENSSYHNFEIIGINNRSQKRKTFELMKSLQKADNRVNFFDYDIPFNFSKINNYAVGLTGGEHIVLMNSDIEIINSDWIECLLEHSQREDVGVVGVLLYYPNGRVQHAGVIIGLGGVAGHSHKNVYKDSGGYCGRLKVIQNLSAVTGACMMTKKSIFQEVGGFDEKLSHAFNDVDYCLKVREKGYLIIYTPYAEFFHHESVSRGYEDTLEKEKRFEKEKHIFRERWKDLLAVGDPYYNPNLTTAREDFSHD